MDPNSDKFIFSAQPQPSTNPVVDSSPTLVTPNSAKRARAESEIGGRNDVPTESVREGVVIPVQEDVVVETKIVEKPADEVSAYGPWMLVSYGKQNNRFYKGSSSRTGKGYVGTSGNSGMARNQTGSGPKSDNIKGNGSGNLVSMSDKNKSSDIGGSGMGYFGQQNMFSKTKGSNLMAVPSAKPASGSRFDVLHEDVDAIMADDCMQPVNNIVGGSKVKGKAVITEVTNLSNLHKKPSKPSSQTSKKWLKKSTKTIPKGGLPGRSFGDFSVVTNPIYDAGSVFPSETEPPVPVIEGSKNDAVLQQSHMNVINSEGQINEKSPIETVLDLDSFEKTASDLVEVMAVISE
ncbi:hypothetical protein Q3G72_008166 [Acer saccharum]|nr:hypothetical protein Q3G72_008166 [Acer saccharum]